PLRSSSSRHPDRLSWGAASFVTLFSIARAARMPIIRPSSSRRRFLKLAGATTAFTALGGIARPYLSRAADRPLITHGVQSGDVSVDSGVVWARTDRRSRMQVEVATTDTFKQIRHAVFVDALPETDFTAKVLLQDIPSGQDIFYRIPFHDLF